MKSYSSLKEGLYNYFQYFLRLERVGQDYIDLVERIRHLYLKLPANQRGYVEIGDKLGVARATIANKIRGDREIYAEELEVYIRNLPNLDRPISQELSILNRYFAYRNVLGSVIVDGPFDVKDILHDINMYNHTFYNRIGDKKIWKPSDLIKIGTYFKEVLNDLNAVNLTSGRDELDDNVILRSFKSD